MGAIEDVVTGNSLPPKVNKSLLKKKKKTVMWQSSFLLDFSSGTWKCDSMLIVFLVVASVKRTGVSGTTWSRHNFHVSCETSSPNAGVSRCQVHRRAASDINLPGKAIRDIHTCLPESRRQFY